MPVAYEPADAFSIKAVAAGTADETQQQRAIQWIIERACGTYDLSYRPGVDGERDTVLAEGRRFVGLQIVKLITMSREKLRDDS